MAWPPTALHADYTARCGRARARLATAAASATTRAGPGSNVRSDRQCSRTTHRKPARSDAQLCPSGPHVGGYGLVALAPAVGCRSGPSLAARPDSRRLREVKRITAQGLGFRQSLDKLAGRLSPLRPSHSPP